MKTLSFLRTLGIKRALSPLSMERFFAPMKTLPIKRIVSSIGLLSPLRTLSLKRFRHLVFYCLALPFLSSCTSFFYFPDNREYPFIKGYERPPESIYFSSLDGTQLHAWIFSPDPKKCKTPKAWIHHFHGNAENLSSHFRFLSWMQDECFVYSICDYRSYGRSKGTLQPSGILKDARAALKFFSQKAKDANLPLITYGQSIGGTLLLRSLQLDGPPPNLKALVIESSFYRYSQIAREKLSVLWLTWPLQWLAYPLVSDEASPGGQDFSSLADLPKLLIYSMQDPVVPYHHGVQIYKELPEPKWFWTHNQPGHVNSMFVEKDKYRKQFLKWLDWVTPSSKH